MKGMEKSENAQIDERGQTEEEGDERNKTAPVKQAPKAKDYRHRRSIDTEYDKISTIADAEKHDIEEYECRRSTKSQRHHSRKTPVPLAH